MICGTASRWRWVERLPCVAVGVACMIDSTYRAEPPCAGGIRRDDDVAVQHPRSDAVPSLVRRRGKHRLWQRDLRFAILVRGRSRLLAPWLPYLSSTPFFPLGSFH